MAVAVTEVAAESQAAAVVRAVEAEQVRRDRCHLLLGFAHALDVRPPVEHAHQTHDEEDVLEVHLHRRRRDADERDHDVQRAHVAVLELDRQLKLM